MSGETIAVFGTQKTLQASGSSGAIANNSLDQAIGDFYDIVADGLGFPDADFVLSCSFATAPTEGTVVALHAQPLAIDGANAGQIPEVTRPTIYIGAFVVNNVTTAQYILLTARDLPKKANYYIHNNGTGQALAGGWTLKVTPKSYKAAP